MVMGDVGECLGLKDLGRKSYSWRVEVKYVLSRFFPFFKEFVHKPYTMHVHRI